MVKLYKLHTVHGTKLRPLSPLAAINLKPKRPKVAVLAELLAVGEGQGGAGPGAVGQRHVVLESHGSPHKGLGSAWSSMDR